MKKWEKIVLKNVNFLSFSVKNLFQVYQFDSFYRKLVKSKFDRKLFITRCKREICLDFNRVLWKPFSYTSLYGQKKQIIWILECSKIDSILNTLHLFYFKKNPFSSLTYLPCPTLRGRSSTLHHHNCRARKLEPSQEERWGEWGQLHGFQQEYLYCDSGKSALGM